MTTFLAGLDDDRDRLLDRVDQLAGTWAQVRAATGEPLDAPGLVTDDLARLRADLTRQHVTIGLFGLIKRGKSTLLNALLGRELSPTHVTPETAVPVVVEHGDAVSATVHLVSGERREVPPGEVVEWTSQRHNAANHRGVTHVRWTLPSDLLRPGIRLVDTPGLDDACADDVYTRRTVQELQTADVGILVFMAPPTVGATEMAFLADVAAADLRRTILVANMWPQHYHDPTAREEVLAYVRRHVVAATGEPEVRLHAVCAEDAWQARRFGDEEAFDAAGGRALLAAVEDVVTATTGRRLVERVEAALDRTTQVALAAVDLRRQALQRDDEDRSEVRHRHHAAMDDADALLDRRLAEAAGVQASVHALVHQAVMRGRAAIRTAGSPAELEDVQARATRELQVVAEDAYRLVHRRVMSAHEDVTRLLDDGIAATLHELGASVPGRTRDGSSAAADAAAPRRDHAPVQGAAVGGLLAGGVGVALVGAALGPVGLVAGALAGWRLGGVVRHGRELRPVREELDRRLGEVAEAVVADLDHRIADLVAAVRETARARRAGFDADLAATLATQQRCPAGSDERTMAVEELTRLAARLRHDPTARRRTIELDHAPSAPHLAVVDDMLEPSTRAV